MTIEQAIHTSNLITDVPAHLALNTIFYGPPGTGKTWHLREQIMPYFTEERVILSKSNLADLLVEKLAWWEVISIALLDLGEAKVEQIFQHELVQAKVRNSNNAKPKSAIWYNLQVHTDLRCPNVRFDRSRRSEPLYFWKDEKGIWSIDDELATQAMPDFTDILHEFRSYQPKTRREERFAWVTFHQSYSYEEFIEGLKPILNDEKEDGNIRYQIEDGIFKRLAARAVAEPEKPFALFIDEINRGNLSKIFGELITLIEADKRAECKHALSALLPYSKTTFSVPPNLYIIGTMNTADRSVAMLDTALRRRFDFVEMMPQNALLKGKIIDGIDLEKLLSTINQRIEHLYDRDHAIGHAYFLNIKDLYDLCLVFRNRILPLLQQYFYNDWEKIRLILGDNTSWGKAPENCLVQIVEASSKSLFGEEVHLLEDRPTYRIHADLANERFERISAAIFKAIYEQNKS